MRLFPVVQSFLGGMIVLVAGAYFFNGGFQTASAQSELGTTLRRTAAKPLPPAPITLTECEQGTDGCATWSFAGPTGDAVWPSGEVGSLTYSVSGNKIIIHREDVEGPSAGLKVTYYGVADGNGINGKFQAWMPGQGESKSGSWYATASAPLEPPSVMHWCAKHCVSWKLESGPPFEKPHYRSADSKAIMTVELWTRDSILLSREDRSPSFNGTAVLRGKLSCDGTIIENGTIEWKDGDTYVFQAAWGPSIGELPGSDAERDAVQNDWRMEPPPCNAEPQALSDKPYLDGPQMLQRLAQWVKANR
ncbi:MAG TPA: hypothetical protein VKZ53_04990 [Candidatus Angelobacter sp.]|nr:hypothetical protein [Candidatus Angelobacter sp.]